MDERKINRTNFNHQLSISAALKIIQLSRFTLCCVKSMKNLIHITEDGKNVIPLVVDPDPSVQAGSCTLAGE